MNFTKKSKESVDSDAVTALLDLEWRLSALAWAFEASNQEITPNSAALFGLHLLLDDQVCLIRRLRRRMEPKEDKNSSD